MSMRKVCAACLTALFAAGTATALQAADAAKTAPSTFKPGPIRLPLTAITLRLLSK